MDKVRYLYIFLIFTSCFVMLACSYGGDLEPVAQQGAELLTTEFKNDTIRITSNLISIQAHGSWREVNRQTSITLEILNNNSKPIAIDFNQVALMDNYKVAGDPHPPTEETPKESKQLRGKLALINGQEQKRFHLSFDFRAISKDQPGKPIDSIDYDIGRIVTLTIPVLIKAEEEKPVTANFSFSFQYAKRHLF